jgi:UDP-N-acetylglucosamine/UDP-N-acetylgalactosamine diphosphorylase
MSSPLRRKLATFGQTHVLRFVDVLADAEREEFLQQLESLDFEAAVEAFNSAAARSSEHLPPLVPLSDEDIFSLGDVAAVDAWRRAGLAAIARGGVAALVLAGGQGTRLRFPHPKGEYDDQLPSHASLFQVSSGCCAQDALPPGLPGTSSPSLGCLSERCMWQIYAERIQRLKELAGGGQALPLLLMTSAATHDETAAFFADHDYFGLPPEDVILFRQGELPAFEADGKVVLETRSRVALVPDGNGGVFEALHRHGVLDTLAARGVE